MERFVIHIFFVKLRYSVRFGITRAVVRRLGPKIGKTINFWQCRFVIITCHFFVKKNLEETF